MKKLLPGVVLVIAALAALSGCISGGRGRGPVESFVIPAAANPGLPQDIVGQLNLGPEPKEVRLVVAPGTNLHALIAKLSLNTEAVITVVSSGSRVVQENGVTPNDFSAPVMYSIEVPGQKEPWRYRVTVREIETNPRLAQLVVPAGARLAPAFDPAVRAYRLEVPFASTRVRIEARAQSRYAKSVTVEGKETPGPAGAAEVDFSAVQEKPVPIETLAEDGATRERYVVTIVRGAPDSNAFLGSLDLQGVPYSPAFSPAQLGYQAVVPFETQSIVVRARPQSPVATVALTAAVSISKGQAAAAPLTATGDPAGPSGAIVDFSRSASLPLVVAVTAQDGSVQQYLIDIRRGPPDPNNLLADLSLGIGGSGFVLSPAFVPSRQLYVAVVPFSTRELRVLAHPQSRVATLELGAGVPGRVTASVRGNPVSPDGAVVDVPPGVDRLPVMVTVTAQNGTALRYIVELRRAAPDRNSDLAALSASVGVLTPAFSPRVISYSLVLPASADSVKLSAAAAGPGATVAIAGQPGIAPAASIAYAASVAPGAAAGVGFVVRAEDGSLRQYVVMITRALAPAPAQPAPAAQQPPAQPTQPQPAPAQPQPAQVQAAPVQQPAAAQQPQPAAAQPQPAPAAQPQPAPAQPAPAQQPPAAAAQQPAAAPAAAGTGHVVVTAKNLELGKREMTALVASGWKPTAAGTTGRIVVRPYRSSEILAQDSVPVQTRMQRGILVVSLQYRSADVSLGRDRLIEVEVVIPTAGGGFLYYKEAVPAADEAGISIPFLLYTKAAEVPWPAIGSPVQAVGYVSMLPPGRGERAEDREAFQKNAKGEYGIEIEITDAKTGKSYGKDTVWRKPGLARGQALMFAAPMAVPEGSTVNYVLSARAPNGRAWTAAGQAQVWTTKLRYEGGFEPVLLPISDELAPGK